MSETDEDYRGTYVAGPVEMCTRCGVIVRDKPAHDRFHEDLRTVTVEAFGR
jgi:hypothetical protein